MMKYKCELKVQIEKLFGGWVSIVGYPGLGQIDDAIAEAQKLEVIGNYCARVVHKRTVVYGGCRDDKQYY
jgi:hypothetical protein